MQRYFVIGLALVLVLVAVLWLTRGPSPPVEPEPTPAPTPTLDQRVDRIRELQQGPTGGDEEREILDLFRGVSGAELRALKRRLDEAMDHRHLVHLAWSDIDDEDVRAELVAWLGEASLRDLDARPLRMLSDIDDTVYCSMHDARFEQGTVYPGVLAFYRELALASGVDPEGGGYVTFITARPGDRPGAVEAVTAAKLREMGFAGATVLAGTLGGVVSHEAMAETKLENLRRYRQLYPEYRFVFVGDSGQGDAAFGRAMLEAFPDDVEAVFIHDVTDVEEGRLPVPEEERAAAAETGLYYFDSYPDAARIAAELGLIDEAAAARVDAAASAK